MLDLLMIVDDPEIALFASKNGVKRLFVDLEYLGKEDRQKGMNTWKSKQTISDVSIIREAAPDAHLLVRINPMHSETKKEIEEVISRGCDSIMVPMYQDAETVLRFFDMLKDRVTGVPLAETKAAIECIPQLCNFGALSNLHIGLNDLHLDLGHSFMFQPIADGILDEACAFMRSSQIKFGIGGIARAREGIVSPDYLRGEHVRLGSDGAILSRTFHRSATTLEELKAEMDFAQEIEHLQEIYLKFSKMSNEGLEINREQTRDKIYDVISLIEQARK